MKSQFELFRNLVEHSDRFVLTTHVNPDGDGLGSELALSRYLRSLKKHPTILNHSSTPFSYQFLDHENEIVTFDPGPHSAVLADAEVIIVLDTNQPSRLANMKDPVMASKARKVVIDHHLDADPFADLMILDESAAATGQIVYNLLKHLKGPSFTPEIAQALYVAIMTDTGSFRFPKTDSEVHRVTAALIESGADPVSAYQQIYEQSPLERIHLLGQVLASLKTAHNGAVAYLTVTQKMFARTNTSEPDVDQFVPYALALKGVRIALMFTELPDQIKVSFRSKGDIWINRLAQEFGGNGHKNAAGARIVNGTLRDVIASVLDKTHTYLD